MKLRFRQNSMRLRLNQREVARFASGGVLCEELRFPGATRLAYSLESSSSAKLDVIYADGRIRLIAPRAGMEAWAEGAEIGIYFELAVEGGVLKVAIEKDLECLDGPPDERDPYAFPREEIGPC